jgi:hypothetical protein
MRFLDERAAGDGGEPASGGGSLPPAPRSAWWGFLAWTYRAFPDPHGIASFGLAASVLLGYFGLDPSAGPHLFSDFMPLEVLGHLWLLLGPPVACLLAARSFLEDVPSPLALVTVPLGGFLTLVGFAGAALGLVYALSGTA